jgi:sulfatase maturation enzyme AslB (radical SAM superfamily)
MAHPDHTRVNFTNNLKHQTPDDYFQNTMAPVRQALLDGKSPDGCRECSVVEEHGKVSGRLRQLLKVGVMQEHFEKSLASSPLRPDFDYSNRNQGHTLRSVTDWQIDLGNYCNGRCIFCVPESSSSLATEFKKIGLIDQLPPSSWCDTPELVDKFIQDLKASPKLQYLHFLGGETVITPGFKIILGALVDAGIAEHVTIGFTTNLTVWSDDVVNLLKRFKQVNLGMSVEALSPINDYVRYPAKHDKTVELLNQWVKLGQSHDWLMQLRITPTCLTVHKLDTVYEYAWNNNIAVESCNFLYRPDYLRISVLPENQRTQARDRLSKWIDNHPLDTQKKVVNTRDPNQAKVQIYQDALSYLTYLDNVVDESYRLTDLVNYLKRLESNRGNNILTYLPEYEDLFRSAGY